jgi:hypothetical protein
MRRIFSIILVCCFAALQAQELNCKVVINYDKVTNVNSQVFKTLETSLTDFINKTVWTEKQYKDNEKISCSVFITINGADSNNFDATIQVQSSRPIYNSSFNTPVLNINDKDFSFQYTEFQNLIYNPNSFDSNLISTIAYYCYMIIGVDAETFALNSGIDYFQSAQSIVNLAAATGGKGWTQSDKSENKYFLVSDLLSTTFKPYREAMFQYHFNGMDTMSKDLKKSKEAIVKALDTLYSLQSVRPNAYLTRVFFDAKSDEILSIFTGGPVVDIDGFTDKLSRLSPSNSSKWINIK